MFEDYGLIEGMDFTPNLAKSTGGRPSVDYALTVDCAKQISMVQRTPKRMEARLYFIEAEKTLRVAMSILSPEELMVKQAQAIRRYTGLVKTSITDYDIKHLTGVRKNTSVKLGSNRESRFDWRRG